MVLVSSGSGNRLGVARSQFLSQGDREKKFDERTM